MAAVLEAVAVKSMMLAGFAEAADVGSLDRIVPERVLRYKNALKLVLVTFSVASVGELIMWLSSSPSPSSSKSFAKSASSSSSLLNSTDSYFNPWSSSPSISSAAGAFSESLSSIAVCLLAFRTVWNGPDVLPPFFLAARIRLISNFSILPLRRAKFDFLGLIAISNAYSMSMSFSCRQFISESSYGDCASAVFSFLPASSSSI